MFLMRIHYERIVICRGLWAAILDTVILDTVILDTVILDTVILDTAIFDTAILDTAILDTGTVLSISVTSGITSASSTDSTVARVTLMVYRNRRPLQLIETSREMIEE